MSEIIQEYTDKALGLHKAGRFRDALEIYNKLLNRDPNSESLLFFMADAYLRLEENGLAITLLTQLLAKNPKFSQAWCNLGVGYRKEGFTDQAAAAWRRALNLTGDTEEVCGNMAGLYADRGTPAEAMKWCDRAIKCNPESAQAHWHKSLALLTMHRFAEGWDHYEWRRKQEKWDSRPTIDVPEWDGSALDSDSHLYLHGEQGVGDEIMFLSCLPYVLDVIGDAKVTVEVNRKVANVVRSVWPKVNVITAENEFDFSSPATHKLPLGSLPKLYWRDTESIEGKPFVRPDLFLEGMYKRALDEFGPRPWIALAWMGGAKQTNVLGRSIPVETYLPLMQEFTCVSGQYEDIIPIIGDERKKVGLPMITMDSCGKDLLSQATLFSLCDAVVTVPQTAMHIAGAVGTPCYVLTPNNADWRFGTGGDGIPYYKSVKLIRRGGASSWDFAIEKIADELRGRHEKNTNDFQTESEPKVIGNG